MRPIRRKRVRRPRRHGGFHPPHCPNPACDFHRRRPGWHYVRDGSYRRPSDHRRIQCFQCRHCGRHFSTQTFSPTYWLRRRSLLPAVAAWISEGPALRQIARVLRTSHTTVAHHVARLGRHCLLFHHRALPAAGERVFREPLVIDGFESFEYSHYFPFHANLAVGGRSHFLYAFNDAPLRRKGRMTPSQKRRRSELEARFGRPDPKAIEKAISALVRECLARLPQQEPLRLHSDEHPAYPRALARLRRHPGCPRIDHRVTSSRKRRTTRNRLFPVNLADLRLRHGNANHRRETIAFSKRRQAALERLAIFVVWCNYIKRRREKGPQETAAMHLGLRARPLRWTEILRRRLFPGHADLSAEWQAYYARKVKTVAFGERQTIHACSFAF